MPVLLPTKMTRAGFSNKWRGRLILYAPLILWIGVIFFLSSSFASLPGTSRFIRPILVFLFPDASAETLLLYHGYIRKFAHFAEYAILAFFAARAFYNSYVDALRKFWFAASMILVLFIASGDEIIQAYIPARTGSAWDVLIDLAGGFAMLAFLVFFRQHWPQKRFFAV